MTKASRVCLIVPVAFMMSAWVDGAIHAQQPASPRHIGVLQAGSWSEEMRRAFMQGLLDAGYAEGRDVAIEWRAANGNYDRLPQLAAELVQDKVDVIVVDATPSAQAAKRATSTKALLVGGDALYLANKRKVAEVVRKARIPAIFPYDDFHESGALMSYGPNMREAARLAAGYVDKILKGANPSELPIQQISRFELVIDRRLTRELGIDVPREQLARANRVLK